MAANEKMVRAAADLYAIREQMQKLFGVRYHEIIRGYAKTVRHVEEFPVPQKAPPTPAEAT